MSAPEPGADAALRDQLRLVRDLAGHRSRDIDHDCFAMNCRALGDEVEQLRAALARPTPALDVEALALALHRWNNHTEWHTDFRGCVRCTPDAANIAREYAVITAYEALAARATEGGTDR